MNQGAAIVVEMPLPRRELSPNGRVHWRVRSKAVHAYRTLAWARASSALGGKPAPRWKRAVARAAFFLPADGRKRDQDNLSASLKAAYDGIADAGIVENDSGLSHERALFAVDGKKPRVEITIQEETP